MTGTHTHTHARARTHTSISQTRLSSLYHIPCSPSPAQHQHFSRAFFWPQIVRPSPRATSKTETQRLAGAVKAFASAAAPPSRPPHLFPNPSLQPVTRYKESPSPNLGPPPTCIKPGNREFCCEHPALPFHPSFPLPSSRPSNSWCLSLSHTDIYLQSISTLASEDLTSPGQAHCLECILTRF